MKSKRVGFLVYPAMQALDIAGPMDAFAAASATDADGSSSPRYELITIGMQRRGITAECGLMVRPQVLLADAPYLDTLVIPGGCGMRDPMMYAAVGAWVRRIAPATRRIAAVCTGAYGLAATGLLDGRRVTTHWKYARDFAQRFPGVHVDAGRLDIKDGAFYTSAGITAGIDLSLALIEEDFGPRLALSVARELVVYLKRSGGQDQYSEPLRFQTHSTDRLSGIVGWMMSNLQGDLSIEALAKRSSLSPRQFSRRFKQVFGETPATFVETRRLEEARRRMAGPHRTIKHVATSVGFRSDDVFRRTFERRYGITPGTYRSRFNAHNLLAAPDPQISP